MKLDDVMDAVAARMLVINPHQVFAYPEENVSPPAAIVSYPERIEYRGTGGPVGMVKLAGVTVTLVVGKVDTKAARDQVSVYTNPTGDKSIIRILEDGDGGPHWDDLTVVDTQFATVTIAAIDYLAATFTLNITCQGGIR